MKAHPFQFGLQALLVCIISAKLCNLVLASSSDFNDRPIIGLLTVPTQQQCPNEPAATGSILGPLNAEYRCYIPAGYAKLIEMTAARVVLLPCNINAKFINAVQSVNGFLLTGMFTDYQCEDTTIPYSLHRTAKLESTLSTTSLPKTKQASTSPFSACAKDTI